MMVKAFCYTIVVLLVLSVVGCTPINSEIPEINDSVNISEELIAQVRNSDTDSVIRLYNGFYMSGFAQRATLADLLSDNYVLGEEYVIVSKNHPQNDVSIKAIRDGNAERISLSESAREAYFFQFNAVTNADKIFSNSQITQNTGETEVHEIYCLNGSSSHNGIYIYFVTDKGDYIFFKTHYSSSKEYLLPLNDFYQLAGVVYAKIIEDRWSTESVASMEIEELYDLSSYRVDPPLYGH